MIMCKAKKAMQNAHRYTPGSNLAWPEAGNFVRIQMRTGALVDGETILAIPVGITITNSDGKSFIPWAAIDVMNWSDPEETPHGADNVEDASSSARP